MLGPSMKEIGTVMTRSCRRFMCTVCFCGVVLGGILVVSGCVSAQGDGEVSQQEAQLVHASPECSQPTHESLSENFPVVLWQTPNARQDATVRVSKPDDVLKAIIYLKVFDADSPNEGKLFVNGNGPITLFGKTANTRRNNNTVVNFTYTTPASWWRNGGNKLSFRRVATKGFNVLDVSVRFEKNGQSQSDDSRELLVNLWQTKRRSKQVVIPVRKPRNGDNRLRSVLTLSVFDADAGREGTLHVNGHGPVHLFGKQASATNNNRVVDIAFAIPASWWQQGRDNILLFRRVATKGFRVLRATVQFTEIPRSEAPPVENPPVKDAPVVEMPEEDLDVFEVRKHEVLELLFVAEQGGNPYLDKSMEVRFVGIAGQSRGQELTIGGFWDGGTDWKVRFAPSHTGEYQFESSSDDAKLDGRTGRIVVRNSNRRGRVQINPEASRYFQWSNGEPFLMIGDTWWHHFYSEARREAKWVGIPQKDFRVGLNKRKKQGFNYAHAIVWYPSTWAVLQGESPFSGDQVDRLNPAFFQEMDIRVQYAADRDFVLGLLHSFSDIRDYMYWRTFSEQQSNRYSQYLINRYGAYPVIWSGVGEYDESGTTEQWKRFARYMRNNDPYGNLVTMHPGLGPGKMPLGDSSSVHNKQVDYYVVQMFQNGNNLYNHALASRSHGFPYVNGEYGYEGDNRGGTGRLSARTILTTNWQLMMAGSAGLVYGNFDFYYRLEPGALQSVGARYTQYLSRFWNQVPYWKFDHFDNPFHGFYEAKVTTEMHVYWSQRSGDFEVDLSDMPDLMKARWFNARTGKWGSWGRLDGGSISVPCPYLAMEVRSCDDNCPSRFPTIKCQ